MIQGFPPRGPHFRGAGEDPRPCSLSLSGERKRGEDQHHISLSFALRQKGLKKLINHSVELVRHL